MVKALKRENKQLQQNRAEKKEPIREGDGSGGGGVDGGGGDDNDSSPPWERRKSAAKQVELDKIFHEKNVQVEQLLADCENLRKENERYRSDIQLLTRQFEECSQQLQSAIQDISSLKTSNEGNFNQPNLKITHEITKSP